METAEFLGPFHRLPLYHDQLLFQDMPSEPFFTSGQLGKLCCFDFDVRPQRTCLLNGRHEKLSKGVDWSEVLTRCILSISRTLGLAGSNQYVERGIEGECDGGAVVCWIRLKRPSRQTLVEAHQNLLTRLSRQNWPLHHPDRVQPILSDGSLNPTPGRDRINIQILDPKTHHTIPMLAENFYFVNQDGDRVISYPLVEWDRLVNELKTKK